MAKQRMSRAAALAAGLIALLVLAGCGKQETGAGRSASDKTPATAGAPAGEDHAHHHGGGQAPAAAPPGHEHGHGAGTRAAGAADPHAGHGVTAHGGESPGTAGRQSAASHAGHAGMSHGTHEPGQAAGRPAAGAAHDHAGMSHGQEPAAGAGQHGGHGALQQGLPPASGRPAGAGPRAAKPSGAASTAPGPVPPGQPAKTLRSDGLDVPALTAVREARRSAEIAAEMSGGHGSHGATYVHVDVGRAPGAPQGAEPQTPAVDPHHGHDHGQAAPEPPAQPGEPAHDHSAGGGEAHDAATIYACPMHPEVTSATPGTCPRCGMDLERREEE